MRRARCLKDGMFFALILSYVLTSFLPQPAASEEKDNPTVCIIPIKGEIELGLASFVNRAVKKAQDRKADAIILQIDTNGGALDATESIMETLLDTTIETYAFIDRKAFSAGAFIAVSTQHIYMAEGSVIGAATPVAMSPTGGPMEISEAVEEKITSGMRALISAAAEKNGHPSKIVEAMVDRDVEIEGVIEKGKLLTLTSKKSKEIGLSEGTVSNINELLKTAGLAGAKTLTAAPSWSERFTRLITSSGVRAALMMLGLLGIYVEVKAPGFGLGGVTAIICFALFFFGHYLAGLAGWEEPFIFIAGIMLLTIEIFLLPGFGLPGIAGVMLIFTSLILAMTKPGALPGFPWWKDPQYGQALYTTGLAFVGSIALGALSYKFILPKTPLWSKLVLQATSPDAPPLQEQGNLNPYLNKVGRSVTMLRPAGKADFDGKLLDVVTEGEFLSEGASIRVIHTEGNRIVVEADK